MTAAQDDSYITYIRKAFSDRQAKNPAYSMRAFARDIGVSAQTLSQVLGGKLGLSRSSATRVGSNIGLIGRELDRFVALVQQKHGRAQQERDHAADRLRELNDLSSFLQISEAGQSAPLEWYLYPTYMLFSLSEAKPSAAWVAERLGIEVHEAQTALDRLFERDLLKENESGDWIPAAPFFHDKATQSTVAIRDFYRVMLGKASHAIENVSPDQRSLRVSYLPVSAKNYDQINQSIEELCLKIIHESGTNVDADARIYVLSTQLFPVDQGPSL